MKKETMSFISVISECGSCGEDFLHSDKEAPRFPLKGGKFQLCKRCAKKENKKRMAKGLPEIHIPADAYKPVKVGQAKIKKFLDKCAGETRKAEEVLGKIRGY
jgi:hypothetical protein